MGVRESVSNFVKSEILTTRRLMFNLLWYGSHVGVFAYGWMSQARNARLAGLNTLKLSVWTSRGAGLVLAYDGFLILVPMCRNVIRVVRPKLMWLFPADENIWFHRQVAYSLAFWAMVHTTAHYVNFINVERRQLRVQTALEIHYTQPGGITGHVMLLIMVLMYSTAHHKIRAQCFEAFWYTHHLAFFFMLALYSHATGCFVRDSVDPDLISTFPFYSTAHCLGYESWRFTVWPGLLYFGERIYREIRARRETELLKVLVHPSGTMELRIKKPSFKYTAGQWLFIQVPDVSKYQWHPFTITSAPEDPYVSVHIRQVGDWTKELGDRLGAGPDVVSALTKAAMGASYKDDKASLDGTRGQFVEISSRNASLTDGRTLLPRVRIDGPYGAPAEDVFKSDVAVLIGAGIGVTPFSSILKHIWYQQKRGKLGALKHVEFFWICRDAPSFGWFQTLLQEVEDAQVDPSFLRMNIYLTQKLGEDMLWNIAINDARAEFDPLTLLRTRTFYGRPDWKSIYGTLRKAIESGTYPPGQEASLRTNVGTFFCGPSGLAKAIREEALAASSETIKFTFYKAEQARAAEHGIPSRSLSLSFKNLSVRGLGGVSGDVMYGATVGSSFNPTSGRRDKKRALQLAAAKEIHQSVDPEARLRKDDAGEKQVNSGNDTALKAGERYLIHDFSGVVKAGEMLLVVGRPGSGCTTFLKAVSGITQGYAGVDGEVKYGNMTQRDIKPYKSQVIFNSEDDIHFPSLLVGQTLDFALRNNTPRVRPPTEDGKHLTEEEYQEKERADLLRIFGLEHTIDTKVGNAYVRGVSGGERKRTSIAEVLTSHAAIQCWDNATRGLDANTALEYARIMRILADVTKNTVLVSLYQAGNQIYDQFDKVLVIAEGQTIYYGPRAEAKSYFENLGFHCRDGANVADFLTGVTVVSERIVRDDFKGKVPTAVADFARLYRESDIGHMMAAELDAYLADEESIRHQTEDLQRFVQSGKEKGALMSQPQTASFVTQVRAVLRREFQIRGGDKLTFFARQGTTLLMSLTAGSLFYHQPKTTGGLFERGGVSFLSILYPSLISLSETTASFQGRGILAKHKGFSMYRPSVLIAAQTIADLPVFFVQLVIFTLIFYFLTDLKRNAGNYFTYFVVIFFTTLSTTAFFRMIGSLFSSFQGAAKVSGFAFSVMVTYAGFTIPSPTMHPWFAWLRWIDPVHYAFEALMSNEFTGQSFECVPPSLVPYGEGYTGANAGCAVKGAGVGVTTISGTDYLATALNLHHSHLWRNFGIIVAMWIFFVGLCMVGTERQKAAGSTQNYLLYKRGGGDKYIQKAALHGNEPRDEEEAHEAHAVGKSGRQSNGDVHTSSSVFTWRNLSYSIPVGGKQRVLLNNVQGWCKPGTMTALMGASGAGKTTLLDVLAQRKDTGEITGEILVNGRQLPVAFQRTTGYCEQLDVHLPQATVREALEFSALLRQPRDTPDEEKLAYVDTIIDLLELHDIEDAIIGNPGAGLGIEQRKRLTIGVELVSKPLLLFLDEPTSGLDGQSSFLIVSFLRKLVDAGQSVLCTIHQPSASLFAEFDSLLLLKAGGRTVYFGKIDEMYDYFAAEGAKCPRDVNPAEFMIDVVSGDLSNDKDWADIWENSDNNREVTDELDRMKAGYASAPAETSVDDNHEFASTTATQLRLVLKRASLWRDAEYVKSKMLLHIFSALFNGFSFWMIGNAYADLQNRLFTVFTFIFVAPGVIAQVQPKFIANRNIFEAREKKAKLYSWWAFIFAEIVAEVPYLLICAFLYFVAWYPVVGFSFAPGIAGPVYLQMTLYEFLYTGIAQFIAAYAPNPTFAALVNPLLIGVMVQFAGVLDPYPAITKFWRFWMYYLDPFNYLIGGLLVFPEWDAVVSCKENEFARFAPPSGQTCAAYLAPFMEMHTGYIQDPTSTTECAYCIYSKGSEYLATLNLGKRVYGYRDICLTFLFVLSSYGFVFIMMKLRSKKSKSAKA
ncbi:hypothetical protein FRB96_007617 [Tulasnella sp. 330]|nr:hypothetical protein FRB96_007617 [Tulasnella sp. 330]